MTLRMLDPRFELVLWLLLLALALHGLQGCGGDRVTRVVTPTEPPVEEPHTGFFLEVRATGNVAGKSMLNARCAIRITIQDPDGTWRLRPDWGCTAGLDEDTARELEVVEAE